MSATAAGELLAALVVIITLARVFGAVARRIGQPAVVGELLVGVVLGPTFFGVGLSNHLFPAIAVRPALTGIGDLGLVLFMFIVGYELDRGLVLSSGRAAVTVAIGSVIAPLVLGAALGFWLAGQQSVAQKVPFALFIAVATAITAFPVLARILVERGMQRTRIGSLALAAASVNDVLAWVLLAVVVIVAKSTSASSASSSADWRLLLLPVYVAVVVLTIRPLMNYLGRVRAKAGRLTPDLLAVILVVVLASAYATEWMGLNFIFGAFIVGALMPRDGAEQLRVEILEQTEHIAVLVLLPVYFVLAGVGVNLAGFNGRDGLDLVLILLVAMLGKFGGAYLSARSQGMPVRQSGALATLMNTRGLTEIVILTTGLQLGIIGGGLYSLMVVMAIVTTAIAGPVLNVIYPARLVRRDIAEANREALGETAAYQVLVATGDQESDAAVLAVGTALAAGHVHAQLVICAVLPYQASRLEVGGGLAGELLQMTEEMTRLEEAARAPRERGVAVSLLARFSTDPAAELAAIAAAASVLVISEAHPDYRALSTADDVRAVVTVAADPPSGWPAVVVQAGSDADATAAAEVASLLAAGEQVPVVVDPAELTGRTLERFTSQLATPGASPEISARGPDGALVVARRAARRAGAHLVVRAGPGYVPAESVQFATAHPGREDR
jgi:Kef-type K+ transport system membrane component KefB